MKIKIKVSWYKVVASFLFLIATLGTTSEILYDFTFDVFPIIPMLNELIYTLPFWLLGAVFWKYELIKSKISRSVAIAK